MRRRPRLLSLFLAVAAAVLLAGCSAAGAERLYALPQLTDEYIQLEGLIAHRISAGGEYAAPTAGRNRQTVQLHDLDGDGTSEAIAFLADSNHTPNVCVYRQDAAGNYYLFTYIEGAGSAVSSVEYADLTGDGAAELILTWQIGGGMRLLSVYALAGSEPQQLLSVGCSGFLTSDLDGDGVDELLNLEEDYYGCTLERFVFTEEGSEEDRARLSDGVGEVLRMRAGTLSDGVSALFVDSRWDSDEVITDVFTVSDGSLRNITAVDTGRSDTVRGGDALPEDINNDRAVEIPGSEGEMTVWYSIDSDGYREKAMTTFHDYEDGWYIRLPDELMSASAERDTAVPGEVSVRFSMDGVTWLTIYTLTGENRLDRARDAGRFILTRESSTVYAAEIPEGSPLTQASVAESFSLIFQDWQPGVL